MLIVGVSFELISTLILYVVWTIILDLILTMIFGGSGRDVEYGFDWNFEDNRGERVWSAWTWISIGFEFELHLQRRNLKAVVRKSSHECSNHAVLGLGLLSARTPFHFKGPTMVNHVANPVLQKKLE